MNVTSPTVQEVGARVADMLADSVTGVLPMQHVAETVQRHEGGTIDTNRNRVRRAIEQCTELELVELTSRRGDWDVMLPDGDTFMAVWIARNYHHETGQYVDRFVHSRDEVDSGYGSGRTTWITTRAVMAETVTARRQALRAERKAYLKKSADETAARWAEASERDSDYVRLLRFVEQAVPGIEVRVMPMSGRPGIFAGIEVPSGSSDAFKALLHRLFAADSADPVAASVAAVTGTQDAQGAR